MISLNIWVMIEFNFNEICLFIIDKLNFNYLNGLQVFNKLFLINFKICNFISYGIQLLLNDVVELMINF